MEFGDPDGHGIFGQLTVIVDGEQVVCHECGRGRRALGSHVWFVHGVTAAEYRRRHGLSTGQSLASPVTRAKFSAHALGSPRGLAALETHRDSDRARAAMTREGQRRPQRSAIRSATGARSRLGVTSRPGS